MPEKAYVLKESAAPHPEDGGGVSDVAVSVAPDGVTLSIGEEIADGGAYITDDVHEQAALDLVTVLKTVPVDSVKPAKKQKAEKKADKPADNPEPSGSQEG